jgi:hypothetical protein
MLNRIKNGLLPTVLVLGSMGFAAHAGTVSFNFNSLAENSTPAQIQAYMNSVLQTVCATCSVTLTGAYADTTYTATGNVVGPGGKSLTLGTSDGVSNNSGTAHTGNNDTFLATVNDADSSSDTAINLVFSGISFTNAGFDYEIFPDASNTGDFTLQAGNGGSLANVTSFGSSGSVTAVAPSSHLNGTSTTPGDGNVQYISTGSWSLGGSEADISFEDWPEAIGIDNLVLTYNTPPVPEPSSILLLASVGAFLLFKARRSFAVRAK